MDNSNDILLYLLGAAIGFALFWIIIATATRSRIIMKLQRMQVEILKEIALKNGVSSDKIDSIVANHND